MRLIVIIALIIVFSLVATEVAPAAPGDECNAVIEQALCPKLADRLAQLLQARPESRVKLTVSWRYPAQPNANTRRFTQFIEPQLKRVGFDVVPEKGEYLLVVDVTRPSRDVSGKTEKVPSLELKYNLSRRATGEEVKPAIDEIALTRPFADPNDPGLVLPAFAQPLLLDGVVGGGPSVDAFITPPADIGARVKDAEEGGSTHVTPSDSLNRLKHASGKYEMEIRVDGKPVTVTIPTTNYPQVILPPGKTYEVAIYSHDTEAAAGALVHIDGRSAMCLSTLPDRERPSHYWLPKRNNGISGERIIPGYFKDWDSVYQFRIGKLEMIGDSDLVRRFNAAPEIRSGEFGVIAVTFHRSYPTAKDRVAAEGETSDTAKPFQTIPGNVIPNQSKPIPSYLGRLRGTIAVRYKTE